MCASCASAIARSLPTLRGAISPRCGAHDRLLPALLPAGRVASICAIKRRTRLPAAAGQAHSQHYGATAALISFFTFATSTFGLLGCHEPVGDHKKSMWLFSASVQ